MKNTVTNNQILKTFIREAKKKYTPDPLPEVTGVMINSANKEALEGWISDLGFGAQQIIENYRANKGIGPMPAMVKVPADVAPNPATEPANPATEPANKLAGALSEILGNIDGKDEELRAEVGKIGKDVKKLGEQVEQLGSTQVNELVVTTPKLDKVNVGKVHCCFETLLTALSCGLNPMLVGPAGSFKTSSAEKAAEALNLECSAVSVCSQTTASTLLGYMNATGDYVATEFRKRYENGGLFILDEIDNGNPNVLAVLNSALANGSCAFPDGMVAKHEDFRLVATANTFGTGANAQYVGRNQLDAATLDRFFNIEWVYDEKLELSIAPNKQAREWTELVISYRKAAEHLKINMVISPRASFAGWKLLAAGMSEDDVKQGLIWKGYSKEVCQKVRIAAATFRQPKGGE